MLIINPLKPFYIDNSKKTVRMGNFVETGKKITYGDENFLKIFESLQNPIDKKDLIYKIAKDTKIDEKQIEKTIDYLLEENFIVDSEKYNLLLENKYNRENLYLSLKDNSFEERTKYFENKVVLILGLGGIGSNVSFMLKRAGFSHFILVDCDCVEESNLIRQLPYTDLDIGKLKTDCLKEKIGFNSDKIETKNVKILRASDIKNEIERADIVVCTLDKPVRIIRRLINELCVKYKKPVLFSGFAEHVGMIGPFIDPCNSACLMCIEHNLNEERLENVRVVPSYGPLCFLISSIVTNEIINYFTKYNASNLVGKTLMFNMLTYESSIIKWNRNKKCGVCNNDSK